MHSARPGHRSVHAAKEGVRLSEGWGWGWGGGREEAEPCTLYTTP